MPSRFSIAGHGVQRARENYVCCTHSNLRIYKLVKLNVCLPPLQPWSYLPVCVYLRVQHRTDLVFHGAGWRWGDAASIHDSLHLLEHLSCPVDNLGCSSRHKILIRVHPICSLGYLHIPSAPAEGYVMYRQITCDGPGWVLAVGFSSASKQYRYHVLVSQGKEKSPSYYPYCHFFDDRMLRFCLCNE